MGTMIEDVYQQEEDEKNYLQEQIEDGIKNRKASFTEGAEKIHEYLPVNRNPFEDQYIYHLWDAFITLNGLGNGSEGFSIMPYHLLFMLSLQYRVMRIIMAFEKECLLVFSTVGGRDKVKLLNPERSVFDLACLNERTIPELFQLLDSDKEILKKIKNLVDYRNDSLAHPKGSTALDYEKRVPQYIEILDQLQPSFIELNNSVAEKWLHEMEPGESGVEYIDLHLQEEFLCPADMQQGKLSELEDRLNEKQE